MRLGRKAFFLLLNGIIAAALLIYFLIWMFLGIKGVGNIIRPYLATKITVEYKVENKNFVQQYMRYDVPFSQTAVHVRYLRNNPSSSRINSFMGMFAEPFAWWLIFLMASAMLLLMNNTVFSKGTTFLVQKKFPWIFMDEYFPFNTGSQKRNRERQPVQKPDLLK